MASFSYSRMDRTSRESSASSPGPQASSARHSTWMRPGISNQQMQRTLFQTPDQKGAPPGTGSTNSTVQGQPVPASKQSGAPQFSIEGQPSVERNAIQRDLNSKYGAAMEFGDFSINAAVRVHASSPTQLKDWDVGVVQMISGAVDTNCYRHNTVNGRPVDYYGHPAAHPVIVNRMQLRPGAFFPDKDPSFSDIFTGRQSMRNLEDSSKGRNEFTVGVSSHDHPGFVAPKGAGAITNKVEDADAFIERHLHHGFFYTYVVAHNRATDALVPLYTANWWISADFELMNPDRTLPVTLGKHSSTFEIISHHPFKKSDFWPITAGIPINVWGKDHREISEADKCPSHSQEIIRAGGGHG